MTWKMLCAAECHMLKKMGCSPVFLSFKHGTRTEDKTHLDHSVRRIVFNKYICQTVVKLFLDNSERLHNTVIPGHRLCPGTERIHQNDCQNRQ